MTGCSQMRVVSVLYHCCEDIMYWLRHADFRSLWEKCNSRTLLWVLSLFGFPWLFIRVLRITSRGERGNEPETSDENTNPCTSQEDVERGLREGQHEGAGVKRPSESDREPESKRPRPAEEEETTEEFYCDYDSTWETDSEEEEPPRTTRHQTVLESYKFQRFKNAARDMQNYRHDYPNKNKTQYWNQHTNDDKPNLHFYLGNTPSLPDGVYITEFHKDWYRDYGKLERVHSYIQWLFPLQEPGMNYEASTLTKEEIRDFLNNDTAKENLLKSYKLMLDFYGIMLCDEATGRVERAEHWRERFNNLNSRTHNNLRITRILKCLGTLGYPKYQAPLVHFFLEETLVNRQLPNVKDSVLSYFVFAVLDKSERRDLLKFAYSNYEPKDEFVWCPKKIQMLWSRESGPKNEEARDALESQKNTLSFKSGAQNEDKESADAVFESCNNAE